MTGKQIIEAKNALPRRWSDMSPELRIQREELNCREMINCGLAYSDAKYGFYDPDTKQFGHYAQSYIKSLGEETVVRLYNEQTEDFAEPIVKHGVYTDSEGCTYNSIIWKDEQ